MPDLARRRPPAIAPTDWLEGLPTARRWVFHGDAGAQALAAPIWGVGFPQSACRAAASGCRATLWLGPDEYLLLDLTPGDLSEKDEARASAWQANPAGDLERALAGTPHAVVDISHRQFALEVRGPHASAILNAACPLDLDLNEFPVGMCTRTVFAKADIVLWRTRPESFHLEVWRSFCGYVTGMLAEIATEYYPAPR